MMFVSQIRHVYGQSAFESNKFQLIREHIILNNYVETFEYILVRYSAYNRNIPVKNPCI